MKFTAILTAAFLTVLLPNSLFAQPSDFSSEVRQFVSHDAPVFMLKNATLIDGTGSAVQTGMSVLVEDGLIKSIGLDGSIGAPDNADIIDLDGKTLLPGLVMLHEHLFYNASADRFIQATQPIYFPRLYLAAGVTTARTAGSFEPYTDLKVKQAINAGRIIGPDLDTTAPFIEGAPAQFLQAPEIETTKEAKAFVNYWADQGMTSFKAYTQLKSEVLRAAIKQADRRGLKVAGHLCSITYADASNMGIDNLEHGFMLAPDFVENKNPDECVNFPLAQFLETDLDSPTAQNLFKTLINNKTAITSTLAVLGRISGTINPPNPDAVEALGAGAKAHYLANHANAYQRTLDNDLFERAVRKEMVWEKAFFDAGGLLVAGSDTTGLGGTVAGYANHEQIELLVQAGFSVVEAIQVVSLNGAISMGRDNEIGSIEPGKKANIIIVDGDITDDIRNIREITTVFKNGIGYDSKALFESARGQVQN